MKKEDVVENGKLISLYTEDQYQVINLEELETVCNEVERRTLERAAVLCENEWEYAEERRFGKALAVEIRAMKELK